MVSGPVVSELRQTFSPVHRQRWQLVQGAATATVVHTVGPLDENREVRPLTSAPPLWSPC